MLWHKFVFFLEYPFTEYLQFQHEHYRGFPPGLVWFPPTNNAGEIFLRSDIKHQSHRFHRKNGILSIYLSPFLSTSLIEMASPSGQIMLIAAPSTRSSLLQVFDAIFEGNEGKNGFAVIVLNTSTKSRGTVRLASDNPLRLPVIRHHTLEDQRDVTSMVEGRK